MLFEAKLVRSFNFHFKYAIFIALISLSAPNIVNAQNSKFVPKPASAEEMNTYTVMSVSTFCDARTREIDFQKSLIISLAGQASAFFQKHGGLVQGSKDKVSEKQFISMSSFRVVGGALNVCPENVPAEEKKKYNLMVKDIEKQLKNR